jgi:hypothetical protein
VARKLTKLDEWPLHQTIHTFDSVETASPNWSDGFWTCVGDPEGKVNLITAIRFYQNTNVADGYAILSLDDGRQYNLRVSRRLRPRIDELDVGPLWMDILEGLRTFRFGCRENDSGIEFDLLWEAAAPAYDETSGEVTYIDGRIAFSRSNYVQVGHLSGTLQVAGRDFQVGPEWVGARDHSWGLGDAGTGGKIGGFVAPPGGVRHPSRKPSFGLRQWCLVRFPTRSLYYWFQHSADGEVTLFRNQIGRPFDSEKGSTGYKHVHVESAEFVDGMRRLDRAVLHFETYSGRTERFSVETISHPLYMQGGGYWGGYSDGLGRGVYRGEDFLEHDIWDVSHPAEPRDLEGNPIPQKYGAWAETYGRWQNLDLPEEQGIGLLECVAAGPYPGVDDAD